MFGKRYDVFFSYSRADSERVTPLRDELRKMGYRVFFDVQSIDPTSPWKVRLRQAIRGSRLMVLCWSEHARGSDYIDFEYMQADALHKPICPWLLDKAPLPPMLDAQAIANPEPAEVAARIKPILGWPLRKRRAAWLAAAAVAAVLLGVAVKWIFFPPPPPPPPPWDFRGEVTDRVKRTPIQGVEVDAMNGTEIQKKVFTDSSGLYDLSLPQPKPETIQLRFRKEGYEGDQILVPTDAAQPFPEDMAKLP